MARLWEAKLVAAVYVALAINKRRKVKRKCWVKNWSIYDTKTSRPSLHAKHHSKSYNMFSISYFLQIVAVTTVILNTVLLIFLRSIKNLILMQSAKRSSVILQNSTGLVFFF